MRPAASRSPCLLSGNGKSDPYVSFGRVRDPAYSLRIMTLSGKGQIGLGDRLVRERDVAERELLAESGRAALDGGCWKAAVREFVKSFIAAANVSGGPPNETMSAV